MSTIQQMFDAHPDTVETDGQLAARCVRACSECVDVCTACADACISEKKTDLAKCIRLNLDCADICAVTGRLIARPSQSDAPMLRALLEACVLACRACSDECQRHGKHMEHCRICSEACDRCAVACLDMLAVIVA